MALFLLLLTLSSVSARVVGLDARIRSFPAFGHFALHDKTGNIVKRSPLRTLYYMRPAPGKPIEALWRKGHEWRKDDSPESLSISGHRSASDEYFSVCVKDGFCDGYDVAGKRVFRFANVGKEYKIQRSQIWLPGDPRPRLR